MAVTTPTWQDLKARLRIQTDAEDGTAQDTPAGTGNGELARDVRAAVGLVQTAIAQPIDAVEEVFVVDRVDCAGRRAFALPAGPIAANPAPVVVDRDGRTVAATVYRVESRPALFFRVDGGAWDRWPYTVTVTHGLSARADYALVVQPAIADAILDLAADRYQNRNPSARSESAGGGVSTSTGPDQVPPRVQRILDQFRRVAA